MSSGSGRILVFALGLGLVKSEIFAALEHAIAAEQVDLLVLRDGKYESRRFVRIHR